MPPGSLVLNREPTLWERDRKYIIPALGVILAQGLLISGLLWQRARKRKAEAVLRESEERFRVMADMTPSLIWMCDAQGKITYLNQRWLSFTGSERQAGDGDTYFAHIHPDDVKNMQDVMLEALTERQPFSREYRLYQTDGTCRWMFDVASPRVNGDGTFAGFIGSAIDVTDQKLAQQALENVSGQLIEAQEKERARIARELHDDICQRLALLSMELEQAKRVPNDSVAATNRSLEEIRKHCTEIAGDVQTLSHELHSSKLEYLGIATAIRGFCKEYSMQHGVHIEFSERDVPRHLPKDVSLCLFRVTQEALRNAVKYSGVSQYTVTLSATASEVQLEVKDAGAGFDVEEAKRGAGWDWSACRSDCIWCIANLQCESEPGMGTKIMAVVPLPVADGSRVDDGAVKGKCSWRSADWGTSPVC